MQRPTPSRSFTIIYLLTVLSLHAIRLLSATKGVLINHISNSLSSNRKFVSGCFTDLLSSYYSSSSTFKLSGLCPFRINSTNIRPQKQSAGFLARVISPSQSPCTYTGKNKHGIKINIHASSGNQTHDPTVLAGEDISCLKTRGHCSQLFEIRTTKFF